MESPPLLVFALSEQTVPLRIVQTALAASALPTSLTVGIAGEATDEELDSTDWEAFFLRWHDPELHDAALLERSLPDEDESVTLMLTEARAIADALPVSAGKFIVADHLKHTKVIYACQLLPALLDDDDHPAWTALDITLRTIAENTDGLIYADAEGFYDADGEPMVDIPPDEDEIEDDETEEEYGGG